MCEILDTLAEARATIKKAFPTDVKNISLWSYPTYEVAAKTCPMRTFEAFSKMINIKLPNRHNIYRVVVFPEQTIQYYRSPSKEGYINTVIHRLGLSEVKVDLALVVGNSIVNALTDSHYTERDIVDMCKKDTVSKIYSPYLKTDIVPLVSPGSVFWDDKKEVKAILHYFSKLRKL